MTTAIEYAEAVRTEDIDFDEAILEYLGENHSDRLDLSFFWVAKIAIGWAAMGEWQKELTLSDDEKVTVRQVIDLFGLGPFVEP